MKKQYLQKLEDREISQERNLQDLVRYAKKITGELEGYNVKVEYTEKIVEDLKSSGNDSIDGLLGMLKRYKRQENTVTEEIDKLSKLILVKDNEIITLNEEINSLNDFRSSQIQDGENRKERALKMIEENKAIIKRQDKLIVDLQQKNELCEIAIATTDQAVQHKAREKSALDIKLKELEDQRTSLSINISQMDRRLRGYRDWVVEKNVKDKQERERRAREEEEREMLAKAKNKRGSPLKSALMKTSNRR